MGTVFKAGEKELKKGYLKAGLLNKEGLLKERYPETALFIAT
jgi:hypothetical protein